MLWIMPDAAYAAVGIFGQWVYVNPESNVVIAMWSAQPKPVGRSGLNEEIFMTNLASAVHQYYSAQVDEE
jgi:CubicO group peptidase (beta-lactamase class C family)